MDDNNYDYDPKADNDYNQESEATNNQNSNSVLAITSLVLGICSIAVCLGPLSGIPAVICGHIVRSKAANGKSGGAGMALGGLITGYLGTLLVGLYLLFMVALVVPAISVAHGKAKETKCMNNLKQIGMALLMYAEDNNAELPPYDDAKGLDLLRSAGYIPDSKIFVCPTCDTTPAPFGQTLTEETCDYNYKGGLKIGEGDFDSVIASDKENNHENYGNAVFMDGKVETKRGSNWKSDMDNIKSKY